MQDKYMLDLILSWLAKVLAAAIDLAIETILPVFGFDFTTFSTAFPFAATAYYIFQRVALAITLIVAVYHLFPFLMSWFGIRSEQLKTTPTRQMGQAVLAVIAIYYGNYIMSTIIDIAQLPFSALLGADAVDLSMDFEYGIAVGISDIFYQQSILLYVILIVMIGWSLIKVILEAVERYIVLYVLVYLSPLAAASLASEETSGIYKRFFSMFISQCLLLLLNVWSLKMAVSMFSNLSFNSSPILGLLMGYAFLRVAQKLDSYMNQLGLNAAITGAGLGNEMFATGAMLMGKFSGMMGGRTAATGGAGGSGGVLGFAQRAAQANGVYNPYSAASNVARAAGSAVAKSGVAKTAKTALESVGAGVDEYNNSTETGRTRVRSAIEKGRAYMKENSDVGDRIREEIANTDNVFTRIGNKSRNERIAEGMPYTIPKKDNSDTSESAEPSEKGSTGTLNPTAGTTTAAASSVAAPSESDLNLIAVNPYTADKVFDSFQDNGRSVEDAKYVTPVLDGIGAGQADPIMAKFVNAGYNNTDKGVRNIKYSLNQEGITASYVYDGREHNLNVVNSSQYKAMHHDEQIAYQRFQSKTGHSYYYKHSDKRVESTTAK